MKNILFYKNDLNVLQLNTKQTSTTIINTFTIIIPYPKFEKRLFNKGLIRTYGQTFKGLK